MFDFHTITGKRVKWEDNIPGWSGVDGYYEETKKFMIIFINGTNFDKKGTKDIWNNFKFWKTPLSVHDAFGKVHAGYLNYMVQTLVAIPNEVLQTNKPIILMGHSAGAAIAVLLAVYLKMSRYNIHNVYTYSMPGCVGDKQFGRTFREMFPNSFSYYVGNDFAQYIEKFSWIVGLYNPYRKEDRKINKPDNVVTFKFAHLLDSIVVPSNNPFENHEPANMFAFLPDVIKYEEMYK